MTADTQSIDIRQLPELISEGWTREDPALFLSLFAPGSVYVDHGAQLEVHRPVLGRHHRNWRGAHAGFVVETDPAYPVWWMDVDEARGSGKCSYRTVNRGTFVNDLPSGRRATNRPWQFSAVMDLWIENGRVVRCEEWLRVPFEDSVPPTAYRVMGDDFRRRTDPPLEPDAGAKAAGGGGSRGTDDVGVAR